MIGFQLKRKSYYETQWNDSVFRQSADSWAFRTVNIIIYRAANIPVSLSPR